MVAIRFLVPGNINYGSGGNNYNAKLAEHLTALGASVEIREVDGDWPVGQPADRRRLAKELDGAPTVLIDGLMAWGAPEEIAKANREGTSAWILSHMALPEHPDLEAGTLDAAAGVICTSSYAAAELMQRHAHAFRPQTDFGHAAAGRHEPGPLVALPGTERADIASGSEPPHIIVVAALLPHKAQMLVVEALGMVRDLPWTAALVGTAEPDPDYAAEVRAAVVDSGLEQRIALTGELSGKPLEEQWHAADLSILVSTKESFGMVVTESLAHGVPVIVRQGTGAVEALGEWGAGSALELGTDPKPLADALRAWLRDGGLREEWRSGALKARENLRGWQSTAATVLDALRARMGR
ncbi:glycosyltransferase family 4 protein [bacterium RCC_150]